MSFQVFPNWCKKIGLATFITFLFLDGGDHFLSGFLETPLHNEGILGLLQAFTGGGRIFDILIIIGLLLYLFAKEKIEDDYMKILRLESYQFAAITFVLIAFMLFLLSLQLRFSLESFISVFIILHLTIFLLKKNVTL